MRTQDIWILAGIVLLAIFGLYAAFVGSDYSQTETPVGHLVRMLTDFSPPAPPSTPEAAAPPAAGTFEIVKPEAPVPAETPAPAATPPATPAPVPEPAPTPVPQDPPKAPADVF